jgi:hypothetical protein
LGWLAGSGSKLKPAGSTWRGMTDDGRRSVFDTIHQWIALETFNGQLCAPGQPVLTNC